MSFKYSKVMSKRFVEHFFDLFCCFWKKSFQLFFLPKMSKSLINSLTFKLKKSKIQLFFRFLQIPSKCEEMVPNCFRSVPWNQNTSFPSRNTLTIYQKKISKPILGPWEADFWNFEFSSVWGRRFDEKGSDTSFVRD